MNTEILQKDDLTKAVECLKNGEPVVFPTETVYGLGAIVFQEEAVRKIFAIKKRPLDNPLIAHIASLDEVNLLGLGFSSSFYALVEAFWPGPLTIVVPKKEEVPSLISAGNPTIAIRMPSHKIARELIKRVGEPLVAPSANLSGRPSPTRVIDVLEDLDGEVRYCIDGGDCEVGLESTVISLIRDEPVLLRPGKITKEMLEAVLGKTVFLPKKKDPILSPGMKYRHYAPKAQIKLAFKKEDLKGSFLTPTSKSFYASLRDADRQNMEEIQVYCDENVQKDAALMNRLLRASGQIV